MRLEMCGAGRNPVIHLKETNNVVQVSECFYLIGINTQILT